MELETEEKIRVKSLDFTMQYLCIKNKNTSELNTEQVISIANKFEQYIINGLNDE